MIFRIVTIILFFTTLTRLSAQVVSNGGRFIIPDERACLPYGSNGEIIIDVPECDGTLSCAIDFKYEPGTPFGTDPAGEDNVEVVLDGVPVNYNYTEPGIYYIAILFGAGTGDIDYALFTVLPNNPPDFNIYTCSNNAVQVDILDLTHDNYTIDYNEDNVTDNESAQGLVNPPYTYPVAETDATITVRPKYTNCVPNSKTAALIPNTISNAQTISRLEVNDADQIDLTFSNTQPNVLYQLDRSNNSPGSFSRIAPITNNNSFADAPAAGQNYYCYRLGAVDICNSATPTFSNTICSISPALKIGDGFNEVKWTTNIVAASELVMTKNGTPFNPGFSNTGTYTDNVVTCGTEYCYQFVMRYGGIESISKTLCGTARSSATPPALEEITTIVNGNSASLEWVPLSNYTISTYDIFRIPTNVSLPLTNTETPAFTDETYTPFEGICYQLRFDDVCKNRSERTEAICPLELTATLNPDDNSVGLTWNQYAGYKSGVKTYVVEKYNSAGQLINEFDVATQTSYVDNATSADQTFVYRVLAYSNSVAVTAPSVSNEQTIVKNPHLWHPTAFVPGSTIEENKTFSVKGIPEYITSYELQIFNRWGELMFRTTDMNLGWDGTFKGVKMPEGSYVFRTKVTDTAGRTFDYSGAVILFTK